MPPRGLGSRSLYPKGRNALAVERSLSASDLDVSRRCSDYGKASSGLLDSSSPFGISRPGNLSRVSPFLTPKR